MQAVWPTIVLLIAGCGLGHAQVHILTGNGSNDRANANLQESQLSPATVNPSTFGKLGSLPVDGQVYAQPLFASGLSMPGNGLRNVVFVATMNNSVYAFDADLISPPTTYWHVKLGTPVPAAQVFGDYRDIYPDIGILSTGAIDLQRGVLYVVSEVIESGQRVFYLHALDLTTGEERLNGPVALTASVTGSGSGALPDGTLPFDPVQHIQRPGLLLTNDAVHISLGSHADQNPYHGWLLSYDAADLRRQVGVYTSTPDGNGGALWQSGRGPAADAEGNIYAITGNGDNDGVRNLAQSFIRISADRTLDAYTPPDWKSMSDSDFDISAGPALIAGTHTVVGADKLGNLYVINGDELRGTDSATVVAASSGSIFNFAIWNRDTSANIYVQGGKDPLKSFRVVDGVLNPIPISTAASSAPFVRIGMTVSANGGQEDSGIVWESTGDYNDASAPGSLHAFDASNLANELWSSDMYSNRDRLPPIAKFVAPTVANGKVYVASSANVVTVYGLLPQDDNGNPGEIDTFSLPRR